MRKTIKTNDIIKALREARIRINESTIMYRTPEEKGTARGSLMLIAGLLLEPLDLKVGTKEHVAYIRRIWGAKSEILSKPNQNAFESWLLSVAQKPCFCTVGQMCMVCDAKRSLKSRGINLELELLRRQAMQACTCDGGGTVCSACRAERKLKG